MSDDSNRRTSGLFSVTLPGVLRGSLWIAGVAVWLGARVVMAQSPSPSFDPQAIIERMEKCNAQRSIELQSYVSRRRYDASNSFLRRKAYVVVEARFDATKGKDFQILERGGSGSVERRVFAPMLQTERANALSPAREEVEISRRNYTFTFESYDAARQGYVFKAEPRTKNKYLLLGKIWINAADSAIERIEGEPAQRPSFWVRRTRFTHEYSKFGGFWFPVSNRTEVDLLLIGHSNFGIDYFDYRWEPRIENGCTAPPLALQPPLGVSARSSDDSSRVQPR